MEGKEFETFKVMREGDNLMKSKKKRINTAVLGRWNYLKENHFWDERETKYLWIVLILLKGAKYYRCCKSGKLCMWLQPLEIFLQGQSMEFKVLKRLKSSNSRRRKLWGLSWGNLLWKSVNTEAYLGPASGYRKSITEMSKPQQVIYLWDYRWNHQQQQHRGQE